MTVDLGLCALCGQPLDLEAVRQHDDRCTPCVAAVTAAEQVVEDAASAEPNPWDPVPLRSFRDHKPERPTLVTPMGAKAGLFYPGRSHTVFGESGTGKSWLALLAAASALRDGSAVAWVDMEEHPALFVHRLRMVAGMVGADLDGWLDLVRFIDSPSTRATPEVIDRLADGTAVFVIDGVSHWCRLHGIDIDSATDVSTLTRQLRYAARLGPAVITVDHSPKPVPGAKAGPRFPLGSQEKLAGLTGSAYRVHLRDPDTPPFTASSGGLVFLTLTKDRPGGVPTPTGGHAASLIGKHTETGFRLSLASGAGWLEER